MLVLCLCMVLGLAQKNPGPSEVSDTSLRFLLDQHYPALSSEQREIFQVRLLATYNRLPRDGKFRELGAEHFQMCLTHAAAHLKGMDKYRAPAVQNPELRPLVLPTEYYESACSLAVQRVEGDVLRLLARVAGSGLGEDPIPRQLDRLQTQGGALLAAKLGSQELEHAAAKLAKSVDQLRFVGDHPFYGFDRTLTEEEFKALLHEVNRKLERLPVVSPLPPGADDDTPPKLRKEDENEQFVSSLEERLGRIDAAVDDAFRTYSRTCGASSWEKRDRIQQNNDAAMKWLEEAQITHRELINRSFARTVKANSETVAPKSPSPSINPSPPAEDPPKAAVASPAPDRNRDEERSGQGGRWGLFALLMLATILVFVAKGASRRSGT